MQRIAFAGGGTGGHLYPGLAVAAAVRRRLPATRISFFTTQRGLDRNLLSRTDYEQVEQDVRPFTVRPWRWPAFIRAWRRSVCAAIESFEVQRPSAVLGLGGYAAGPPVIAARKLGIRTAILNPDAVPGRANRFLSRRCDLVAMQWEASRVHFRAAATTEVMGCPIRAEFATARAEDGQRIFGLDPARPTLLVTGASQGARSLNETLCHVWPEFLQKHPAWQLLHLTGVSDEERTRNAYGRAGAAAIVMAFTHDMPAALAAADLVISRAGASTLAELTALGKPSILLPYPYHRDRHQHANARVLVSAGAAVLVEDRREAEPNRAPLLAALEHCAGATARAEMAAAAARLGRRDAAENIAAWLTGGTELT